MSGNAPVIKFKAGAIAASVWENPIPEDPTKKYRTVSIERNYKDRDGKWQSTSSYRISDLPKVALVANKAFDFLVSGDGDFD